MNKWYIPTQDKQNAINSIVEFLNQYGNLIVILSMILVVSYIYFRNKVNLNYLLDTFVISSFLLILYIVLSPHRYHGLAYFISMTFR